MNITEHLLVILGEECAEVAQRASKAARFGLLEVQPGQPENNTRRLERELADLMAVAEVLGLKIRDEDKAAKLEKMKKFMDYSREIGTLERRAGHLPVTEDQFIIIYGKVVTKAKEILAEENKTCGDHWPGGQAWEGLAGTSKSIFMTRARRALEIDEAAFLYTVRNWPYSNTAQSQMECLFGL